MTDHIASAFHLDIISTHILTRRMTYWISWHFKYKGTFQLTSSQGGWRNIFMSAEQGRYFNSHPHKEDDVYPNTHPWIFSHFNSHPHKEDDRFFFFFFFFFFYFNSHPHKEDDYGGGKTYQFTLTFQLTSSQGGWHQCCSLSEPLHTFQLTSSQGGWLPSGHLQCKPLYFNSHPHKEDDEK